MEFKKILNRIRPWMLPISMTVGAAAYLIYHFCPALHPAGPVLSAIASKLQPILVFCMLFLSFSRIEPRDMKPHRWHWWLLLIQASLFVILGLGLAFLCNRGLVGLDSEGAINWQAAIESAMLCLICPTATAAAVVTFRLGGNIAGLTTYIVLINLVAALIIPTIVPLIHPIEGMNFSMAFNMIIAKIFPILILPCICSWLVKYLLPKVHAFLMKDPDLSFYIWTVALALAICVTTKAIIHSSLSLVNIIVISLVSIACCAFQFACGKWLGNKYGNRAGKKSKMITASQAMGQKNTIFAIWLGITFLSPESSIACGLYSIWQNVHNSRQLHKAEREGIKLKE